MKRLMVIGGLTAVLALLAASQHSPPIQDQSLEPSALVAKDMPSFESAVSMDLSLTQDTAREALFAVACGLRNYRVQPLAARPTWRGIVAQTDINANANSKHVSNASMRGWGFL